MSTPAISNQANQPLQEFHPTRTPDDKQIAPATNGAAATTSASPNHRGFFQQRKAALEELGATLQSGDSAATQKAYDALIALGQTGPLRNGRTFRRADRAQEFGAIGDALKSGDLAAAQTAFTALASSFNRTTRLLGPPVLAQPPSPSSSTNTLPLGPPTLISPSASAAGGPVGPPQTNGNAEASRSPQGSKVNLQA